jgi:hypothetical protein
MMTYYYPVPFFDDRQKMVLGMVGMERAKKLRETQSKETMINEQGK